MRPISAGSVAALNRIIVGCSRCPRLRRYCAGIARARKPEYQEWHYWAKPVPGFGDPNARLLLVGLAPGAHGSNRTGRMFTGDASGEWLYEALHRFGFASQPAAVARNDGLRLVDCYITAAARCAPPANKPSTRELDRCRPYLTAELRLLRRVRVVVALGRVAHESWLKASGWWAELPLRKRPPFAHGAVARLPDGIILISSYHPSRQNTNTGKLTRAMWHGVFRLAQRELSESRSHGDGSRPERAATAVAGAPG